MYRLMPPSMRMPLLLLALCVAACAAPLRQSLPTWDWAAVRGELLKLSETGGESIRQLQLRPGSSPVKLTLSATTKGNGSIQIQNLRIRALDTHDDGRLYGDGFLQVGLVDLDEDMDLDLIVSGVLLSTEEQHDQVTKYESIVYIYRYDHHHEVFVEVLAVSPIKAIEVLSATK